jgi:hypothetical protein
LTRPNLISKTTKIILYASLMSLKVASTGESRAPPTFLYDPAIDLSHSRYCKYVGRNSE